MKEKVSLPKKFRVNGLFLVCNYCKRTYSSDRKVRCKHNSLQYKARIHIPGSINRVKTKSLSAKNIEDALTEYFQFRKEHFATIGPVEENNNLTESKPLLLKDCIATYIRFLNDEDVPEHRRKNRSVKYLNRLKKQLRFFTESLELRNLNVELFRFTDLNDFHVGYFHSYLLQTKKHSNVTYNGIMQTLRLFTTHIIEKYFLRMTNPFKGVSLPEAEPQNDTITEKEFLAVLAQHAPENSFTYHGVKRKEKKNFYKPWMKEAFWLALLIGRRREEIVELKWNGIELGDKGEMQFLYSEHFKLNRMLKTNEKARIIIGEELKQLLLRMGYETHKGKDQYILAPEETMKRLVMMELISRAFSLYYNQLQTGRKLHLKHLRKTFNTSAFLQFGDSATVVTNHKQIKTLRNHYVNKMVIASQAQKTFTVFNKPKD